jgi:hypothetical protein
VQAVSPVMMGMRRRISLICPRRCMRRLYPTWKHLEKDKPGRFSPGLS